MKRLSVQLPEETVAALAREAARGGVSVAMAARQVIERGLRVLRRAELERQLQEGYAALPKDHRNLIREMKPSRWWGD